MTKKEDAMTNLEKMKERYKEDPREVTTFTTSDGHEIVIVGKPNIKLLAKKMVETYFSM